MTSATKDDEIYTLAKRLKELVGNARQGLPLEIFHLVSSLTPMINVDLLIRNEQGRTLLTWRADEFYGPGWHIPGGIIRFKEDIATRIAKVAENELGGTVDFDRTPLTMREIMATHRDVRGHFISLLYRCRLRVSPAQELAAGSPPQPGQWQWHEHCPDDLIRVHEMYRPWINPTLPDSTVF